MCSMQTLLSNYTALPQYSTPFYGLCSKVFSNYISHIYVLYIWFELYKTLSLYRCLCFLYIAFGAKPNYACYSFLLLTP